MRSPSSFKVIFTVPCVDGCDGPIWISIGCVWRSSTSGGSVGPAAIALLLARLGALGLLRRDVALRDERLALLLRVVLAQRMTLELLVQIDAAPDGRQRSDARTLLGYARLQTHPLAARDRAQVVHELETRCRADVVDGGHVGEEIERRLGIVAEERTHVEERRGRDLRGSIAAIRMRRNDRLWEALAQTRQQRRLRDRAGLRCRFAVAHCF